VKGTTPLYLYFNHRSENKGKREGGGKRGEPIQRERGGKEREKGNAHYPFSTPPQTKKRKKELSERSQKREEEKMGR